MKLCVIFSVFSSVIYGTNAFAKQGIWENIEYDQNKGYLWITKSMYKDTVVSLKIDCSSSDLNLYVTVDWLLRYTPCAQEFQVIEGTESEPAAVQYMMDGPHSQWYFAYGYDTLEYINGTHKDLCLGGQAIMLPDKLDVKPTIEKVERQSKAEKASESVEGTDEKKDAENVDESDSENKPTEDKKPTNASRRRRAETAKPEAAATTTKTPKPETTKAPQGNDSSVPGTDTSPAMSKPKIDHPYLVTVWKSGYYVFIVRIKPFEDSKADFKAKVTVTMKGKVGYISAVDWPLLIFYGVMGLVYIIYGLVWLVLLACNWRDLMRLQYWIGGVIVLGMLEKAVFYADYQNIANNGQSVTQGTVIFAEIVSALKRALARMLVIIVSVGFGIVKPRLGPTFHKVLCVGGLYFIISVIEGCLRTLKPKADQSTDLMLAAVPLAVVDASICWWIFSSLVQTTRQLRLRRNVVKLSLYRHFTNTLIFAVLASIVFMIWSIIQIKMKACIKDWHEIWIDEAFWHLLFSAVLAVIMILWRPSSNNQRYAFSPLIDAADDEDEEDETVLNDAFDGMKNRTKQSNGSPRQKQNSIEDDLKWVEENIPSTLSDKAQTLIESDEEIMTVKYEMSKMQ